MRRLSFMDGLLLNADTFLKSVVGTATPHLPAQFAASADVNEVPEELSEAQRQQAAAYMRVNHVGEICAQALYRAQALMTTDQQLRAQFDRAAQEEKDHLDWTRARIEQLGGRPSLLNPLWYAGAFGIGLLAGRCGDKVSLGFMAETERQVEAHLESHLRALPESDHVSRAIVAQMQADEVRHATQATQLGGVELPAPVQGLMRAAAKVMTTVAHHL